LNFFAAQDNARRKTLYLALLFSLAVITLIVLTNLLIGVLFFVTSPQPAGVPVNLTEQVASVSLERWALISIAVIGVVGIAMLYKYVALKSGGRGIAEALGGSLIHHDTRDPLQRRLLNVVEEMAIASGTPVPPVYLIPEPSINAFAAGFSTDDAVIGINQGTLEFLSRDELQGVVAHEFSHILNGDMNINLRLIAILHGIIFLGMIGYIVVRTGGGGRKEGMPVLLLGLGLIVIGFGGTFFGNMIKAAVSRQREYLADSAAVQYTRNPTGIANALKKIGGLSVGSRIEEPAASEVSHMFFGQIQPAYLGGLTATHPPLPKRIKALDPSWDGQFTAVTSQAAQRPDGGDLPTSELASGFAGTEGASASPAPDVAVSVTPDKLVDEVGSLSQTSVDNAALLLRGLEPVLRRSTDDPWSARALIYAMLLDADQEIHSQQMAYLYTEAEAGIPELVEALFDSLAQSDELQLSILVDLSVPTLKELSTPQYDRFIQNVITLIRADKQIKLHEWVLHRVLLKELHPNFYGHKRHRVRYRKLNPVLTEALDLLAALASEASENIDGRKSAYLAGVRELGITSEYTDTPDPNYSRLNDALKKLREIKPLLKPKLLKAAAACVLADDHLTAREGALLHGIAATLDCPLPPSIYTING
jgi:Zn-dependent protease with chaperone function